MIREKICDLSARFPHSATTREEDTTAHNAMHEIGDGLHHSQDAQKLLDDFEDVSYRASTLLMSSYLGR